MQSSFLGIEIAKKALFAQQRAQLTVSHNMANSQTPGYSRQRAMMESTYSPYSAGNYWQMGTGVKVSDVNRLRDEFTDMQFRNEHSGFGQWQIQGDILRQVETVFNEPSDIGISSVLNEFWKGLETLSKSAGSHEARETVKERGVTLANTINQAYGQLVDIQEDINYRISIKVDEINSIARQITKLNAQIQQLEITGVTAPDLRDQRDLLLDDLSTLVKFDAYEDENGLFTVNIGGGILVKGHNHATVEFDPVATGGAVKWKEYGIDVDLSKGELRGLVDLRDNKVGYYIKELKTFTQAFAEGFNEIHRGGFDLHGDGGYDPDIDGDKGDFFVFSDNGSATLLSVHSNIIADPSKIAAAESADGIPDDNRNALNLAVFRSDIIDIGGRQTSVTDFYGALISKIGVDSQEATRMADSQAVMVSQLQERRMMTSSVSMDEEMSKMIIFLHAYTGAARVMTAFDEMIDTVVNRLGLVGR